MKKTNNKWKTEKCPLCDNKHSNYTGKLDKDNIEYVICEIMQKKCFVNNKDIIGNKSNWIKK